MGRSLCGLFACLLFSYGSSLAGTDSQGIPSYSGFADIDPAKSFFIIVGDTQRTSFWEFWREKNNRERTQLIDEIARRAPAFVVHLGDLTARGESMEHWSDFDKLHKEFVEEKIPYFPILGNHEYSGNEKVAFQQFFGRFAHLQNRLWYSFTWKNVAFIMLNSNFASLTKEQIKQQNLWYSSELERYDQDQTVDYVLVCCHEPPFTNSRVVLPNEKSERYFAAPFLRHRKTALFFSGHAHTYEHFLVEGKTFIVSGGGGGPRQKVAISPRRARYKDLFSGGRLRFFHFCQIEPCSRGLLVRVVRLDGDNTFSVAESFVMAHP